MSFRTLQFGTLALMQDAHVNMPYQSWELRPRAANHAQLTVTAAVVEVEIQIKVRTVCRLGMTGDSGRLVFTASSVYAGFNNRGDARSDRDHNRVSGANEKTF